MTASTVPGATGERAYVERRDVLLVMTVPCWEDACWDCPDKRRCICACHDEPPLVVTTAPEPEPVRCRSCGYLADSVGCGVMCGTGGGAS